MNVYIDSSVAIRVVFGQPRPLPEWKDIQLFLASSLLSVECYRTIYRLREADSLPDDEFVRRLQTLEAALTRIELLNIGDFVVKRASEAFALPLKTLDAIHLATAILWREREDPDLFFATHDKQLGSAARAEGFTVLGL